MKYLIPPFVILSLFAISVQAQPWQPQVIWQRQGQGDSSLYGYSIVPLGDQNDDGFNDWAVFAYGHGPAGGNDQSMMEFFHGGNPPFATPYRTHTVDPSVESRRYGGQGVGDVNGDGYQDWIEGVDYLAYPDQDARELYFGGPSAGDEPDIVFMIPWFSSIRGIGDFNGDGYDDLLFGDGTNNYGEIYFGGNPMDTIPDWHKEGEIYVQAFGDVNGDGYSDFIIHPFLFLGSANPDTIPDGEWVSGSVVIVEDLNGDSFDDFLVARAGAADVLLGGAIIDTVADTQLHFPCGSGQWQGGPDRLVSAGDWNGDGYRDVVMLAWHCEDSNFGTLTVHLGHPWLNPEPVYVIYGWTPPLNLIRIQTAVSLGDINGDGVDDLAIGAWDDLAYAGWRGKVVILGGDTNLVVSANEPHPEVPQILTVSAHPNPFNSSTTVELTVPAYAREADLRVHNLLGQEVFGTALKNLPAHATYTLDASALSTGVYLLRVQCGHLQATQKLIVLK